MNIDIKQHPVLLKSSIYNPFKAYPKEVWIGWFSSTVEAYNMAIYSFVAPMLATWLFQKSSGTNALLFSYVLVFLAYCLFYPLGAVYYGYMGDKKGRQSTCIYSTFGLGAATGLMGLVQFDFLGGHAWICFLFLICAQHFFSGGEYHGSVVFSLEHSEEKQTGLMSAFSCLFAVFGIVAANGLASISLVAESEFWVRMCFIVGAVGGCISYLLKNHCRETPAFESIQQQLLPHVQWSDFVKHNWNTILTVACVWGFFLVAYSFIFIFLPLVYAEQTNTHFFTTFKSLIAYGILLVGAGIIADRIGVQKLMLTGISLFSALVVLLCFLTKNLFVLQMSLTLCACLAIGPIHGWMLQQFNPENRCRGIFLSSAIATSLFGGSTIPICLIIFEKTGSLGMCGIFPMIIALMALSRLLRVKETKEILA